MSFILSHFVLAINIATWALVPGVELGVRYARNAGEGRRAGLIRGRFQKLNPVSGLWDKYDCQGNYLGTKRTGKPFKAIVSLVGRNPKRP